MDNPSKMQPNPLGDRGKAMENQYIQQKEREMAKAQAKQSQDKMQKASGEASQDPRAGWAGMLQGSVLVITMIGKAI
ncbi:hypothetical protein S7711_11031 [Stachybotrys chartarum IBT 7711]|uniref:Uncharacterized protein n=1 Tax=Stachybotrys chartarum (strain CBS 109288 / IBT 7711) TaxID=1280523 RepID=A0A084AG77_STACB|nr:hypothetical protein S7711_11031 [Stachybotrys chartarum IBT 7711]